MSQHIDAVAKQSDITAIVDNIDSFISIFQKDVALHNVRIASGTLSNLLYGNGHSGGCTGYRVDNYIIYTAVDSDGLFYTGWITISQKTATFSGFDDIFRLKYKIVSLGSITMNDKGYYDNRGNRPSAPNGTALINVSVASTNANSIADCPFVQSNGDYLYGEANKTYASVTLKYIYARASEMT